MEADGAVGANLEALSTVITALAESPFSESLHYQHVALSEAAGLSEAELEGARDMLTSFFAAGDDIWLPLLKIKTNKFNLGELSASELEEFYLRAERDYLSIPVLGAHLGFLVDGYSQSRASGADPDGFFEFPKVQAKMTDLLRRGTRHMTQGQEVWGAWRDWYQSVIEDSKGGQREEYIQYLKNAYLERITVPHSDNDATFQAYSTFVSTYLPAAEYESSLVHATNIRQPALSAWRNRERFENNLTNPQAYQQHIAAEKAKRKRSKDPRVKDPAAILTLYERAIADAAKRKSNALYGRAGDIQTAEAWLAAFWDGLVTFLQDEGERLPELELEVLSRSVRSLPASATLWTSYIRSLDYFEQDDKILEVYEMALASGLLPASSIGDLIVASITPTYRKLRTAGQEAAEEAYIAVREMINEAIQKIRGAGGDPRLKAEKFLVHMIMYPSDDLEDLGDESAALAVWESAVKHYSKHWHVWTGFTEFLTNMLKSPHRARKAYKDVQPIYLALDYPETVFEAWISFEETWGNAQDLDYALRRVRIMSAALAEKRMKDMNKAARAQAQVHAEQVADAPVSDLQSLQAPSIADIEMEDLPRAISTDESTSQPTNARKRKAEDETGKESKKNKPETQPPALKRDREKSTVFVGPLWPGIQENDITQLFKDCGAIREIKLSEVEGELVATVEFQERGSVSAALTKDKKRIQEKEVAVHLAWQSTLYVTNFPTASDDASIRNLFGEFGKLLDVRWPSKKFKSTRRFCYVQFTSPASAQAALVLDRRMLEPNMPLSVAISNPERKKERTDAGANEREIYVAGLSKNVNRRDLEEVFAKYGTLKDIRVALDDEGRCKGFAFVEYEQEIAALAALAANNHDLKNRRIAVTLADSRVASRRPDPPTSGLTQVADVKNRSVRIRNIPTGAQEGLLQQALEKAAEGVKKVEIFEGTGEGLVEFETAAEAGKLLLLLDGLVFQEQQLTFEAETTTGKRKGKAGKPAPIKSVPRDVKTTASSSSASTTVPTPASFVPRAAKSRPKAGLGHKKALGKAPAPPAFAAKTGDVEMAPAEPSGGKDQDDFRKMLSGS